jgi:hypothetical protein
MTGAGARRREATFELMAETLREGGSVRLRVSGWCMEPLLRDGDEVTVVPLGGEPHRGRLLLARSADGELVCHRVLGRTDDGHLLAGDRTLRVEEHPPSALLGELAAVHRGGRTLPLADTHRPGSWRRLVESTLARWQLASHRLRHRRLGRVSESLRARVVALWHHLLWPSA